MRPKVGNLRAASRHVNGTTGTRALTRFERAEYDRRHTAMVTDEVTPASRRVRCPTCGAATVWRDNPQRPFCSLTCRLIDLGGWLDERYRVPPREDDEGDSPTHVP